MKQQKSKEKIVYFNPPFSLTVATKIGKEFLNLVNKHFDTNHSYHKNLTGTHSKFLIAVWKISKQKFLNTITKY